MGGGSHNPDSDIGDRPSFSTGSVSGAKSSHDGQSDGNIDRDLSDAYAHMSIDGGHRVHGPERNSHHDDMQPNTRSVPGGAQGGRGLGSYGTADQKRQTSQWHDMSSKDADHRRRLDLVRLRKKKADLEAYLGAFKQMSAQEMTAEEHQAAISLMEIEDLIFKVERGKYPSGKACNGMRGGIVMSSMDPDRYDRYREKALASLRKEKAELEEFLQAFKHIKPHRANGEHAGAMIDLMDIEKHIFELERGKRLRDKAGHGTRERMDSIAFDQNQSRAGDGVHQSTDGLPGSEHSKPSNIRTEGRHPGGSGHGSGSSVTEADIISTTRDSSRLGIESREGAQMHRRSMGPSSHCHDMAAYAGEESDYHLGGARCGYHHPPAGHGHQLSRHSYD